MDTSEQYIEMCKQAIEIQAEWKRKKEGDFFFFDYPGDLNLDKGKYIKTLGIDGCVVFPHGGFNSLPPSPI